MEWRGVGFVVLVILAHVTQATQTMDSHNSLKKKLKLRAVATEAFDLTHDPDSEGGPGINNSNHGQHSELIAVDSHSGKDRIDPRIVAMGQKFAIALSVPTVLYFLVGSWLAFLVHRNGIATSPPAGSHDVWVAWVGIAIALGLVWYFFLGVTRPVMTAACPSGEDCSNHSFYWKGHLVVLCVVTAILIGAGVMVTIKEPVRPAALVGHLFTQSALIIGVFMQAFLGAITGEWSPEGNPDYTISSSMDYVPGAIQSMMLLAPMAAFIPLYESMFIDSGESFQRGLRVAFSAIAAAGVLAVVMTPLETEGVSTKTRDTFKKWHTPVAAVAFGFLAIYLASVGISSLHLHGASFFVIFGLVVLGSGVVLLGANAGNNNPIRKHMFAIGEYLSVVAVPIVGISRFQAEDVAATQAALIASQE